MVNISGVMVAILSVCMVIGMVVMLTRKSKEKRYLIILVILTLVVIIIMFRGTFIVGYPDAYTMYHVEGTSYTYNPELSVSYLSVKEWIKVDGVGSVYLSGVNRQKGSIRLFVRVFGTSGNDITELEMLIKDDEGNEYKKCGGYFNGGMILSSASIDFVRADWDDSVGAELMLTIEGKDDIIELKK